MKPLYLKIAIGIFLLSFLVKLGSSPLLEIDEAIYAEVAREAYTTGDYFSAYFNYETEFSKPPFQYFLLQISYAVFGINEWAVRLPSFMAALGILSLVYLFGKNIRSSNAGLWACLVLCANPGFYGMIRDARMDLTLTFFITLSIYGFYVYTRNGAAPLKGVLYMYGGIVAATLTKGPIGLIFPTAIIFVFIVLKKDWGSFKRLNLFYGLLLLILLTTPWYIYMTHRYGFAFFEKNIIHENFRKFLVKGVYEPNPGGHLFLSHTFLWYFFPWWLLWFYQQYLWIKNKQLQAPNSQLPTLLLLWFYIPFVFFSMSKFSLPNYLSVVIPAASLGAGIYIDSGKRKKIVEYIFSLFSLPLMVIALLSSFLFFRESLDAFAYIFISGVIIFTLFILIFSYKKEFFMTKVGMALLIMTIQLLISVKFQPLLDVYKPAKPIADTIKSSVKGDYELGFYKTRFFQSIVFYTGKKAREVGSEDSLLQFIDSPGERFIITEPEGYKGLPESYKKRLEVIGEFPYFPLSKINYSFLNPNKRKDVVRYIVLMRKIL